ncbi:MAG: O-antigen ligase family protein [Eubacteriales bacterium]|nr:O-antigen ligase family protein [Eubacteriales bacterium]
MEEKRPDTLRERIGREGLLSRGLCAVHVLFFALVHILFFRNGFFDINRSKYSLLLCACALTAGLGLIFLCAEHILRGPYASRGGFRLRAGPAGALLLTCAAFASACLCPDPLAGLTGSEGRCMGALCIAAMCFLYACCLHARLGALPVVGALTVSGVLCAGLGVLNFLRFDPLGFYVPALQPIYHDDFISTIGNINFFSAYMCLMLGLCAGLFLRTDGRRAYLWLLPLCLCMMGLLAARSESGFVGLAAVALAMCAGKMRSMREAGRACVLLGALALSCALLGALVCWRGEHTMELYPGIATTLLRSPRAVLLLGALALGGAAFFFTRRESAANVHRLRRAQNALLLLAAAALAAVVGLMVYFTALRPDAPLSGPMALLRMDVRWGTFRGFIWQKTAALYAQLPPLQKLLGVGPDLLKPLLEAECYDEMVRLTGILFDNAHNEYLQLLITTGALGLAGYLLMVAGALRALWQNMREQPALFGCFLALCAHLAQAAFNIAQPETTPAVFLLLAVGTAAAQQRRPSQ